MGERETRRILRKKIRLEISTLPGNLKHMEVHEIIIFPPVFNKIQKLDHGPHWELSVLILVNHMEYTAALDRSPDPRQNRIFEIRMRPVASTRESPRGRSETYAERRTA